MSFYGLSIIYGGRPSEEFGLMLAHVGSTKQEPGKVGGKLAIMEDRTSLRHDPIHYGTTQNDGLSFPISLVVSDGSRRLDRYDIAAIAGWLSGHKQYKELVICQEDMAGILYRALITELEAIEVGSYAVGVRATVVCDAPYAYFRCADTVIEGGASIYHNRSNLNDYYLPKLILSGVGAEASIVNKTTGETFALSGMSAAQKTIHMDCANGLLESSDGADLYECWNEVSPRFVRGGNLLAVSGGTLTIKNEFPWSIGY